MTRLFEDKWEPTRFIQALEERIVELELEQQEQAIRTIRSIQACRTRIAECQRFMAEESKP